MQGLNRKFAWKKDKFDRRDFIHVPIKALPDVVNMEAFLPAIRDQGNVGSCTGFGIGINLTAWAKKKGVFTEWFSPTWIYNGARFIAGDLKYDDGAYPKDCMDWIKSKGCLLEHFWPYNPNKVDTASPPSKFNAEAAKFPILSYTRVTGVVDGICSALAGGYFVSLGAPWYEAWMDVGATGMLPMSYTSLAGGHETCIFGYDRLKKLFFGANSWGTGWGRQGKYSMPFSAFDHFGADGGYDAHYVDVKWSAAPPPPPDPPPPPAIVKRIRVQESIDGEKTWMELFKGDLK